MNRTIAAGCALLLSAASAFAAGSPDPTRAPAATERTPVICALYAFQVMSESPEVKAGNRYGDTHYPVPLPIWLMMNVQAMAPH